MSATLTHLTLSTGDLRIQSRHEASDANVGGASVLIRNALAVGSAGLPEPLDGYGVTTERFGAALMATVLAVRPGGVDPIAVMGVSATAKQGRALYRRLEQYRAGGPLGRPQPMPPAPWCVAVLLPGLLQHPGATEWLGALERDIAWAWLERDRD